MTNRLGRADLHIHTLASDGTAGVLEILDHVERNTGLDVIAITDHERVDAAIAARAMAQDHGVRFEVIVGEEVTTRGGHLLALFIDQPIKPLRSLRETIARVHDQGGIAIPAHPLVPYPLCAQGGEIRRLAGDGDPASGPTPSRRSIPRRSAGLVIGRRSSSRTSSDSRWWATATRTRWPRSGRAGRRSRVDSADDLRARDRGAPHALAWQLPRHPRPAAGLRTPAAQVQPRLGPDA